MSIERNTVGGWQHKKIEREREHIYMHDTQIRHNFIYSMSTYLQLTHSYFIIICT